MLHKWKKTDSLLTVTGVVTCNEGVGHGTEAAGLREVVVTIQGAD
jgi:hypothetical protein